MQLAGPLLPSLLATHCVRLLKETGARTGHLLPFVQAFVLGMHESCFILGEKRGLGMVALPFLIRLRLRFLSALRLLAGRFGVRGTEDPIDLRSPRGYDLSLLVRSRACHVFASVHARP